MRARHMNETTREYAGACLVEIDQLQAEVKRLKKDLSRVASHPLVMEQGGTSDGDRACRVINKLAAEVARLDTLLHRGLGKGM